MRTPSHAFRSRTPAAAVVAVLCGFAAACSSSTNDRFFTGATPNQREIIGATAYQPLPAPVSNDAVIRTDLPPAAPQAAYSQPVYAQPAPVGQVPLAGQTYAWSAVGGQVTTVAPGETLDVLAIKYGVPQNQILAANQLTSAADIRPGRVVVIPHRVSILPGQPTATVAQASPPPAAIPAAAATLRSPEGQGHQTYTVVTGDTLYSIGRRTGASVEELIALNRLENQSQIRIGQVLRLPAGAAAPYAMPTGTRATQVASLDTPPLPRLSTPVTAPAPSISTSRPPIPSAPPVTPASLAPQAALDDADPPSANGTAFRWPVRGRIISGFGSKPNGQKNDGINLSVPEGTSVKAAEAGTVIYAGNELEGYGNLILVRHADGWVSAYAHNKDLLVKRGDTVRRGQTIAHAGMSGSVSAPQVHFELRQGARPVNPLDYLTG
jgi:murein DD-endopeptidase MepM/ murein hydrolase activator NlpD